MNGGRATFSVRWALLLLAANLLLLYPELLPNLPDMSLWDEADYIKRGRDLVVEGTWPALSASPLAVFMYGLVYLFVRGSEFWLVHAAWVGRTALFVLLWGVTLLIARRIDRPATAYVVLGLFLASPAAVRVVQNGSDALFAATSGLALWQLLEFRRFGKRLHVWLASGLVALAALSRPEGFALFGVLMLAVAFLVWRSGAGAGTLAGAFVPVAGTVGLFLLASLAIDGRIELGLSQRAYSNFEQGQGKAYEHRYPPGADYYSEGELEARRLFGTPEENGNSVLRAVRRNPSAYAARVASTVVHLPEEALFAYGSGVGLITLLLALQGAVELARRRRYGLLGLLLLWPSYLILQVLVVYRTYHLLMPFYVVLSLAAVGVLALVREAARVERLVWALGMSAVALVSLVAGMPGMFTAAAVFASGLWAVRYGLDTSARFRPPVPVAVLTLLALVLAVRQGFPTPETPGVGTVPEERAATVMREHLAPGSKVAAYSPGNVWTADMTHVRIRWLMDGDAAAMAMGEDADVQSVSSWLSANRISAVYMDWRLKQRRPDLWAAFEAEIGRTFDVAYRSDDGEVQLLLVRQVPSPHPLTPIASRS